jgi:DUF4097 and DUF4098 domain-containing protein YvlB
MNSGRDYLRLLPRRLFFIGGVFLLAGCGSAVDRMMEQAFDQSYHVQPNATVSIRNTDGSIRIYGADTSEIKIQAIKKAYDRDRLDKILINVAAQPGSVSIETTYPPKPKLGLSDRSGTVDYVLIVPQTCSISRVELVTGELLIEGMRGKNVQASLVNGRLAGHNCFGDLHLFVANGALDVAYDWWEKRKFSVDATIVNGNARAFIPGDAAFHLVVTSDNGNVASEFTDKENRHHGARKIDSTIGAPSEAELTLHATNGSIRIAEVNP